MLQRVLTKTKKKKKEKKKKEKKKKKKNTNYKEQQPYIQQTKKNLSPKEILTWFFRTVFFSCFLAYFDPRLPIPITPVQQEPTDVEDTGNSALGCLPVERIAQAMHAGKQEYL